MITLSTDLMLINTIQHIAHYYYYYYYYSVYLNCLGNMKC